MLLKEKAERSLGLDKATMYVHVFVFVIMYKCYYSI